MPLQPGQILNNRYRIVKLIASGGFGTVYRAWDMNLNKPCALKENLDPSAAVQNQFMQEASILASLIHPNLPRVIDYFNQPGQGQFLVMDFVEGEDLETIRTQTGGALPEAQLLPWIAQVCDALAYLHRQNPPIIHRDVKPANIRITPQGTAILVDFGIAKQSPAGQATKTGAHAVTPGYSPPEQYTGAGTDQRADIYSLGTTLYTLLSGMELPESVDRMVIRSSTQPPHLLRPGVKKSTSLAVMRAINPQKELRFDTITEFRAILLQAPPPGRSPGAGSLG